MRCGDVHPYPGPPYPCGVCSGNVTWRTWSVRCSVCSPLIHRACSGLLTPTGWSPEWSCSVCSPQFPAHAPFTRPHPPSTRINFCRPGDHTSQHTISRPRSPSSLFAIQRQQSKTQSSRTGRLLAHTSHHNSSYPGDKADTIIQSP